MIGDGGNEQDDWAFTPTSRLPDAERFRGVVPLRMICRICHEEADFQGVFAWDHTKPVKGPFDIKASSDVTTLVLVRIVLFEFLSVLARFDRSHFSLASNSLGCCVPLLAAVRLTGGPVARQHA